MAEELVMPRLSDTMEEGTIGRWLKQEGDAIKEGDVLAEIETDKATMEFQAYADGTLLKILVGDGETVALGAPIALIGEQGEEVPDAPSGAAGRARRGRAQGRQPGPAAGCGGRHPRGGNGKAGSRGASHQPDRAAHGRRGRDRRLDAGGSRVGPRGADRQGRRRARDRRRRGRAGRRTRRVLLGARRSRPSSEEDELRDLTPMLKAIARRMSESKTTVPHFYLSAEIDMTRAGQTRRSSTRAWPPPARRSASTT